MLWGSLAPELTLCGWILLLLAADTVVPARSKRTLWILALCGVAASGLLLAYQPVPTGAFQGMLLFDPFSRYFKWLFLLTAAIVIVMTREFPGPPLGRAGAGHRHLSAVPSGTGQAGLPHTGAFYLLLFTALLGTFVLASVNDLLMLFLGLELLTFSLYIMAAYLKTDARSVEAGMKYLILGSVSSGFLVFGIALLYGFAGHTGFPEMRAAFAAGPLTLTAQAGLFFVLAGLGFKVAAVPFQLWVPDVYEGAPTPVVAFLSVGSKMAGMAAILRFLYGACLPLAWLWGPLLAVIAAATVLYGNLGALPQTNIKRLLGYSAIGHAGYLLMGLSTASPAGTQAVGYYLLAYLFSNLTAFLVVVAAADAVGGDGLDDYKGLSKRSGWLAAALFIALLSLAGVPPMGGFVGKLLVLLATAESGRLWLVALGAVNVAISLYYYLMVVKRMYLDAPASASPIRVSRLTTLVLAFLIVGIFALGIFQEPFLQHIASSVRP